MSDPVEAAWEAMRRACIEAKDTVSTVHAKHRPLIEAATRSESAGMGLDEPHGMTPNEMRRRWPANVEYIEREARESAGMGLDVPSEADIAVAFHDARFGVSSIHNEGGSWPLEEPVVPCNLCADRAVQMRRALVARLSSSDTEEVGS